MLRRVQQLAGERVAERGGELAGQHLSACRMLVHREAEAQPELGVVLEERVRPGRPAPVTVRGEGRGGEVAAVDRRAAGGVRDQRAIAEELRQELYVGGLAAARAGARVLEERLEELAALHVAVRHRPVRLWQRQEEGVVRALGLGDRQLRGHVDGLVPRVGAVLGRTDLDAQPAARAVVRRHLDRVVEAAKLGGPVRHGLERGRRRRARLGRVDLGPDGCVRAHERALVALDAEGGIPHRNLAREGALLPAGGADRPGAVDGKRAHGEQIAVAREQCRADPLHELRRLCRHDRWAGAGRARPLRQRHLVERGQRGIHRGAVAFDDGGALATVGLRDGLLDARDGRLARQHAGEREERGLRDGVDAAPEAELAGERVGVDHEQPKPLLEQRLLHLARQVVPDGRRTVGCIQQHGGAGGGDGEHVEALEEAELVAADEVGPAHEVGRADGTRTEAEVRHGDGTGLLGIVDEVALPEAVVVLGQDLDRVLVRPHRAVGAEPVEHGAHLVRGLDVEVVGDAGADVTRDVVDDALRVKRRRGVGASSSRRTACTMAGVNSFEASP